MLHSPFHFQAFTLVELIVVITIIGILSTIGFLSYSNYLSGARDSNRISQMTKLSDALQVYSAKKSLPLPENKIDITASGTIVGYQGELGTETLEILDYTNGGLDPKDKTPFTYYVTSNRKKMQLLAFMEEAQGASANLIGQSYAVDYKNRFPKTYGTKLGVMTDTNNTPLQELTIPNKILDITNVGVLTLKSYLSETELLQGSGNTFQQLATLIPQGGKFWKVQNNTLIYSPSTDFENGNRYPGCDTNDITVGNYTIAACNVGSPTASTNWTISRGSYFQWGRNKPFAFNDASQEATQIAGSIGLNTSTDTNNFVWSASLTNGDWATTAIPNTNNWGGTSGNNTARQGPCAQGYRVPTQADWEGIVAAGGWGQNGAAMQTALQLPYAGYRHRGDGTWINGGLAGVYWSSIPSGFSSPRLFFNPNYIASSDTNDRTYGFSVRCFKN